MFVQTDSLFQGLPRNFFGFHCVQCLNPISIASGGRTEKGNEHRKLNISLCS